MAAVDLDELETLARLAADNCGKGYRQTSWGPRDVEIVLALITELRTLRASAAEGQREWVKCSGRMPEDRQLVYSCTINGVVERAQFDAHGSGYFNVEDGYYGPSSIAHWMPRRLDPLPSPPEKGST